MNRARTDFFFWCRWGHCLKSPSSDSRPTPQPTGPQTRSVEHPQSLPLQINPASNWPAQPKYSVQLLVIVVASWYPQPRLLFQRLSCNAFAQRIRTSLKPVGGNESQLYSMLSQTIAYPSPNSVPLRSQTFRQFLLIPRFDFRNDL